MLKKRAADIRQMLRRLSPKRINAEKSTEECEELVSRYFQDFKDHRKLGVLFVVRHPRASADALAAMYRLPLIRANLSDSVEGAVVRRGLFRTSRQWRWGRTLIHQATSVLALPRPASDYAEGSTKQTLRRKVRAAQKLGVHWKEITDTEHRRQLLELANDHERTHAMEMYRDENPHNDDLLDCSLWLTAYSRDDRPILLCVIPIDGEWSVLRYFRALGVGDEQTNARYLMTQVLVEHLVARDVRWLADSSSPVGLANGLRHYQRMLGFRIVRVKMKTGQHSVTVGESSATDVAGEPLVPVRVD